MGSGKGKARRMQAAIGSATDPGLQRIKATDLLKGEYALVGREVDDHYGGGAGMKDIASVVKLKHGLALSQEQLQKFLFEAKSRKKRKPSRAAQIIAGPELDSSALARIESTNSNYEEDIKRGIPETIAGRERDMRLSEYKPYCIHTYFNDPVLNDSLTMKVMATEFNRYHTTTQLPVEGIPFEKFLDIVLTISGNLVYLTTHNFSDSDLKIYTNLPTAYQFNALLLARKS